MSGSSKKSGFSLIELLVAMLVMAILGLLTVSIISATNRGAGLSNQAIDAAAQARLAFNRIGIDMRGLIKRNDLVFETQNIPAGTTTDLLRFASSVSSVTPSGVSAAGNRSLSIIAYQLSSHSDNAGRLCLLRGAKAIQWSVPGFFGLQSNGLPLNSFPSAFAPAYPADYDVLAAGVIRMVVGFQLYPDNQPVTLADGSTLTAAQGQIVYSPPIQQRTPVGGGSAVIFVDYSRISSLIVGLVTLDLRTLRLASVAHIKDLAGAFTVPTNGVLPVQAWFAIANNPSAMPAAVPLSLRQALRVFERSFPMTPYGTKGVE